MTFSLPFPPLLNRYYSYWRGGRQLTAEARTYKLGALVHGKAQGIKPLDGDVCVQLTLYRRARRGDIDAPLKCLFDSLQGLAYQNDSQIRELHVLQLEDAADPRVRVSVTPWRSSGLAVERQSGKAAGT